MILQIAGGIVVGVIGLIALSFAVNMLCAIVDTIMDKESRMP